MAEPLSPRRHGSYGVDAPIVVYMISAVIAFYLVLAFVANVHVFIPIIFMFAVLATFLHTTRRGKFRVWFELLDELHLRGDEHILDIGCGRGAVLLMATQRLTTGRAVGVDLWRTVDQSGNSMDATQRNAVAEGVADRIELHTGDMTTLPFVDDSFDVVLSSLAIHNISATASREKAIDEAVRVLRPGARLMIADIRATQLYQARLAKLGMNDIARRRLGWRFWWGGPWGPTWLVTATKPRNH